MSTNEDDSLQDRGDWLRTAEEIRTAPCHAGHSRRSWLRGEQVNEEGYGT